MSRTVILSDLHGDLDIFLKSLARFNILDTVQEERYKFLKVSIERGDLNYLNDSILPQKERTVLVFLGDHLDRYYEGWHILNFLNTVAWEAKNIRTTFLIGNHDLLNLVFFLNPYQINKLYSLGKKRRDNFGMFKNIGLMKNLKAFFDYHERDLVALQLEAISRNSIDFEQKSYKLSIPYKKRDIGLFQKIINGNKDDRLDLICDEKSNWWRLESDFLEENQKYCFLMEDTAKQLIPIDWRIISIFFRQKYGDFFQKNQIIHLENAHLFLHGSLSPLALMQSPGFGNLLDFEKMSFEKKLSPQDFSDAVKYQNRVFQQLLSDALNNYSFSQLSGLEVIDQIGKSRSSQELTPDFAGPIWEDFFFLSNSAEKWIDQKNSLLIGLYKSFFRVSKIKRVVCGHASFSLGKITKYLQSEAFKKLGVDYICIDNRCSKGYVLESENEKLNGIEIDKNGKIKDLGKVI